MVKRDKERANQKAQELKQDLVDNLSDSFEADEEDLDDFADEVMRDAVRVRGPEIDTTVELMVARETGGRSTKPGNIRFTPTKVLELAASGSLTVGSAVGMQVLAPAAAIVLWASILRGFSVDVSTEDAFIYWTIWKNSDEDGLTPVDKLPDLVAEEIENIQMDIVIDESDIEKAIATLQRIDSIQIVEQEETEYYHAREYCKATWD